GERGADDGERGVDDGERGADNGEQGAEDGERGEANGERGEEEEARCGEEGERDEEEDECVEEEDERLDVWDMRVEVSGMLEVDHFKAAWANLVERHAALRTSLHWQEVAHPVQVVARRVTLPWEEKDWRDLAHLSDEERQRSMAELLRADLQRGFDLAQ